MEVIITPTITFYYLANPLICWLCVVIVNVRHSEQDRQLDHRLHRTCVVSYLWHVLKVDESRAEFFSAFFLPYSRRGSMMWLFLHTDVILGYTAMATKPQVADSSDSEEFYDAEEFTPVKGSKWVHILFTLFISVIVLVSPRIFVDSGVGKIPLGIAFAMKTRLLYRAEAKHLFLVCDLALCKFLCFTQNVGH